MVRLIIYDILKKSEKVNELLGENYFHLFIPEDTEGIALYYKVIGSDVEYDIGKHSDYKESTVDFILNGSPNDDFKMIQILDTIRYEIEEAKNSVVGGYKLNKAQFVTESEDAFTDGYIEQRMTFSFKLTKL